MYAHVAALFCLGSLQFTGKGPQHTDLDQEVTVPLGVYSLSEALEKAAIRNLKIVIAPNLNDRSYILKVNRRSARHFLASICISQGMTFKFVQEDKSVQITQDPTVVHQNAQSQNQLSDQLLTEFQAHCTLLDNEIQSASSDNPEELKLREYTLKHQADQHRKAGNEALALECERKARAAKEAHGIIQSPLHLAAFQLLKLEAFRMSHNNVLSGKYLFSTSADSSLRSYLATILSKFSNIEHKETALWFNPRWTILKQEVEFMPRFVAADPSGRTIRLPDVVRIIGPIPTPRVTSEQILERIEKFGLKAGTAGIIIHSSLDSRRKSFNLSEDHAAKSFQSFWRTTYELAKRGSEDYVIPIHPVTDACTESQRTIQNADTKLIGLAEEQGHWTVLEVAGMRVFCNTLEYLEALAKLPVVQLVDLEKSFISNDGSVLPYELLQSIANSTLARMSWGDDALPMLKRSFPGIRAQELWPTLIVASILSELPGIQIEQLTKGEYKFPIALSEQAYRRLCSTLSRSQPEFGTTLTLEALNACIIVAKVEQSLNQERTLFSAVIRVAKNDRARLTPLGGTARFSVRAKP